jgi:crossover junction endodeoxyribonuclease RuvC
MRLLGIDPGLRVTGWGLIETRGNRLSYIADGVVRSTSGAPLAARLLQLFDGLCAVIESFSPIEVAVEETFVNSNAASTLKLGQARGIALLVPARFGLTVAEYPPNLIKKSVVGVGHAAKGQVQMMVRTLLPGCLATSADAADALAIAICHAHHRTARALSESLA